MGNYVLGVFILVALTSVAIGSKGKAPTIQLNDGRTIPLLGLGTFGSDKDKAKLRQTVTWAVQAGYRQIDTAAYYENEDKIGLGIADVINEGLVTREDLFITTKLANNKHARDQVVPALRESLRKLGLSYVDLYLIHFPDAEKDDGSPADIDYLETWQGMEEAQRLGLVKSIGISNFKTEQIDRIISNSKVVPAVNQIEIHPANTQEQLVRDCHARGIAVIAYSPFGFLVSKSNSAPPPRDDDPTLVSIAKKYGKSTSQVVLRYLIDRYLVPIPKSTNKERLEQNIDVFDFYLTEEEIATISKFNSNSSKFA